MNLSAGNFYSLLPKHRPGFELAISRRFSPILNQLSQPIALADILRFYDIVFHFYAVENQLCTSFSVNDDMESFNGIAKIEERLADLDKWVSLNKLKLNKDKMVKSHPR